MPRKEIGKFRERWRFRHSEDLLQSMLSPDCLSHYLGVPSRWARVARRGAFCAHAAFWHWGPHAAPKWRWDTTHWEEEVYPSPVPSRGDGGRTWRSSSRGNDQSRSTCSKCALRSASRRRRVILASSSWCGGCLPLRDNTVTLLGCDSLTAWMEKASTTVYCRS